MKRIFRLLLPLCAVLLFALSANAQDKGSGSKKDDRRSNQNVAVIVVKSAAKAAWVTTKFVAKDIAKPVFQAVIIKAAPKLTVYALKKSPMIAKRVLPYALKLALL